MKKNVLLDRLSICSREKVKGADFVVHRNHPMGKICAMLSIFVLCQCFLLSRGNGNTTKEKAKSDVWNLINEIENSSGLVKKGEFSKTEKWIESKLLDTSVLSKQEIGILQKYLADIKAIKQEYTLTYADVFKELQGKIPDLSARDVSRWENDGSLEYYLIDGAKKYFDYCIYDLFYLNKEAAKRAKIVTANNYDASKYPLETIQSFENGIELTKKIFFSFTFFEDVSALPDHTVIKAWIPYVRENRYQENIQIVRSSVEQIVLPQKDEMNAMIYFEKKTDLKNNSNAVWRAFFKAPTPFWLKKRDPGLFLDSHYVCQFIYSYESKGYFKPVDPGCIRPYKVSDEEYLKYTRETDNMRFTPYLKKLSTEIIGNETNPYLKAKKIYQWICENIVWTNPKSVLGDYAEYTAKYKHGDCEAKANLFISLCRNNNIPAKSQGGWGANPTGPSQHSWAQVYFEPLGWLPVDVDAGSQLISHKNEKLRFFYFCNRTPYRMIIYDDESALSPVKKFACIYGGGVQLGAFEWENGDIEPNIIIDSHVE